MPGCRLRQQGIRMTSTRKTKIPRFLDKDNPLEKKIEEKVCRFAREKAGLRERKYANPNRRSAPDRIFFVPARDGQPARIFMIEFKRLGETSTPAQVEEQNFYREIGIPVFEVDNVEYGIEIIRIMA